MAAVGSIYRIQGYCKVYFTARAGQRHILGAVKKSKLCGTAPDYKGKMCGKVR